MRNAGLEEAQAGIKIAGRNINNLRYADDTTLMAESEEELSLWMKVKKESERVGLKLNIQKTKIMASGPITLWELDGETVETVSDFIFLDSKITTDGDCRHEIKRCSLLGRKVMTNLDSILEKGMAPHSSTLAWKIPWTEEPGGLQSMGRQESDTTERFHFHFSLSCTGEGNGNPLQCSCLENPRDWGAWWAAVYGVAQSRTRLKQLGSSSSSTK